jgi:hypothetical protein
MVGLLIRAATAQWKKSQDERDARPSVPRSSSLTAQREWNCSLDARGAQAFWAFGDTFANRDWIRVTVRPVDAGLTLTPKQYRPGQPDQPVTIPWDTVLSATRASASDDSDGADSSDTAPAVVKLNLHALGEPGAYPTGELAVIRCFGKDGATLVTQINKHLYGRVPSQRDAVATRPAPPRPAIAVPPPPAAVVPPIQAMPAEAIHATAAEDATVQSVPAVADTEPVAVPSALAPDDAAPVSQTSELSSAEAAVDFDGATSFDGVTSADLQSMNLDALTPPTIEMSTFDAPLDLTSYAPTVEDAAGTPPLVAAPWPPPVAFQLPDSVKGKDESE